MSTKERKKALAEFDAVEWELRIRKKSNEELLNLFVPFVRDDFDGFKEPEWTRFLIFREIILERMGNE